MTPTLAHVQPWLWTATTWTAATFLVLFGAAVVAFWQVFEARSLRHATLRPFVVVDFEVESGEIYLAVSNIGKTMARDVRVTFDKPLESGIYEEGNPNAFRTFQSQLAQFQDRLASGIPALPPGKSIRMLFDLSAHRPPEKLLADVYKVSASYKADATGKHNEEMDLDFGVYRPLVWVNKKGTHEIAKAVEDLVTQAKKWSSGRGVLVTTNAEERDRFRAHVLGMRSRRAPRLLRWYWRLRARLSHR